MSSVFEIFKIGIGPSSSHTVAPMKAAKQFVDNLRRKGNLQQATRISIDIYGSLSLTGKGHHTDTAILLGLAGHQPETVNIEGIPTFLETLAKTSILPIGHEKHPTRYTKHDMTFHWHALPLHENGMQLQAWKKDFRIFSETYYSLGGGAIVTEDKFLLPQQHSEKVKYPFTSAKELLDHCNASDLSISGLMMANEQAFHSKDTIDNRFTAIWEAMKASIDKGCKTEGRLAGPLKVPRRAPALFQQLHNTLTSLNDPMAIIDWVNMFALAVSEENAAGGRIVTSPTNGAAGIIPAVLAYYDKFIRTIKLEDYSRFFLTAAAICLLYKRNASISGAEVGCQGEVGVACSIAAAGLAELQGATPSQVCIAAEIGMEHNLGLTCDPVLGQVQVPCIERNAMAAMKAINATRMAMQRDSDPRVSLDKVIETMYETGKDMHQKYRETSQGGLAIKVVNMT